MTDLQQLQNVYGEDDGFGIYEVACRIWADRMPWARALEQAEEQFKDNQAARGRCRQVRPCQMK